MAGSWKTKIACLVTAAVCLAALIPVQARIDSLRETLAQQKEMPRQLPVAAATSAVLGGFRGIAVDILWVQADAMINNKQFYQLATLYELISVLQPNFPAVWQFNAWNLAFNISAEWGRVEEKWDWVKQGLEFAQRGMEFNPDSPGLAFDIAFFYGIKIDTESYFINQLREEKGQKHWQECYKYAMLAAELAHRTGDSAVIERRLAYHALFQFGKDIATLGNLAEAKRILDDAEEGTTKLLSEFPEDMAMLKLVQDIRAEKAKYGL